MYEDLSRPPLDAAALRRALVTGPLARYASLDVLEESGSTNAELLARAGEGAPDRSVLVAEHQSAGRGRLGRAWTAPPRSQVAVSVLLRPGDVAPSLYGWLPLVTGLGVADALAEVGGVQPSLKWPNDVLVGGRKIAGILVELSTVPAGGDFGVRMPAVVVGVGLNVGLTQEELPVPHATSLQIERGLTDRNTLTTATLRSLAVRFDQWRSANRGSGSVIGPDVAREYDAVSATLGHELRVERPDGSTLVGSGDHIDPEGRLNVRDGGGVLYAVTAGDVTHLRSVDGTYGGPHDGGADG